MPGGRILRHPRLLVVPGLPAGPRHGQHRHRRVRALRAGDLHGLDRRPRGERADRVPGADSDAGQRVPVPRHDFVPPRHRLRGQPGLRRLRWPDIGLLLPGLVRRLPGGGDEWHHRARARAAALHSLSCGEVRHQLWRFGPADLRALRRGLCGPRQGRDDALRRLPGRTIRQPDPQPVRGLPPGHRRRRPLSGHPLPDLRSGSLCRHACLAVPPLPAGPIRSRRQLLHRVYGMRPWTVQRRRRRAVHSMRGRSRRRRRGPGKLSIPLRATIQPLSLSDPCVD